MKLLQRCPTCLEELRYLSNPKLLACGHIYCLPCIENAPATVKSDKSVKITCTICGKKHEIECLNSLPAPEASDDDERDGEMPAKRARLDSDVAAKASCDSCKNNSSAVCFCVDCGKKLCSRHEELHQDLFGAKDAHKLIPIQKYLLNPATYVKAVCRKHGEELGTVCVRCYHAVCLKCETRDNCSDGKSHEFRTLKDGRTKLVAVYEKMLEACSKQLAKMCKQEKQTWQRLDQIETDCSVLIRDLTSKAEELINRIRKDTDSFIQEIRSFEDGKKMTIENYLENLRTEREALEDASKFCSIFVNNNPLMEIVKDEGKWRKELEKFTTDLNKSFVGTHDMTHLKERTCNMLTLKLTTLPDKIEFVQCFETSQEKCYCTAYKDNGNLLVGTRHGMFCYPSGQSNHYVKITDKQITSIAHRQDIIYILHSGNETDEVVKMVSDEKGEPNYESLFGFDELEYASFIAATDNYIVVVDSALTIYNIASSASTRHAVSYGAICADPSDNIYVTDNNQIRKYQILEGGCELNMIWITDLEGANGICIAENGLLYVTCDDSSSVCIISPEGVLMRTLYHPDLADNYGQISVWRNMLAVPFWSQNKFKLFEFV